MPVPERGEAQGSVGCMHFFLPCLEKVSFTEPGAHLAREFLGSAGSAFSALGFQSVPTPWVYVAVGDPDSGSHVSNGAISVTPSVFCKSLG